jgi:putative two-component system response regulator
MTPLTSVLIVDDEPAVRELMARWVSALGLRPETAADAAEALASLRLHHYDLAVIDVMMPGRDGLWLATEVQRDHPNTAVVIATAHTDLLDADREARPIADFLIKPFARERFALALERGRQWRKQALEELHWHALLSIEMRDRAEHFSTTLSQRAVNGVTETEALMELAIERIPETAAHCERVARYAESVARELGLDAQLDQALIDAARFHDIGKAAMPDALLSKPGPLTPGEMAIMRQHVELGAEILGATRTLGSAAEAVRGRDAHARFRGRSGSRLPRMVWRRRVSAQARGRGNPAGEPDHRGG